MDCVDITTDHVYCPQAVDPPCLDKIESEFRLEHQAIDASSPDLSSAISEDKKRFKDFSFHQ